MTTEDDFQRAIDSDPQDWHTRLVFADWLDDHGDPRADGYRAIATQQRYPLEGKHGALNQPTWWWHCGVLDNPSPTHNDVPPDWYALLPAQDGNNNFWPLHTATGGMRTRRECENALALVFAQLPAARRDELLAIDDASVAQAQIRKNQQAQKDPKKK